MKTKKKKGEEAQKQIPIDKNQEIAYQVLLVFSQ